MSGQLPLDLPAATALGRADFLPAEANAGALAWIDRWPDWPLPVSAVVGPEGSGKTHLLAIWAARAGAAVLDGRWLAATELPAVLDRLGAGTRVALDDADAVAGAAVGERALFHLYNWIRERGGALLMAARTPPARWRVALPDLSSRLRTAHVVTLGAPDDALLEAVLFKLFHDRQVAVGMDVVQYLARRMERSLSAAGAVVDALDRRALAAKRPISVRLARELAAESGWTRGTDQD